MRVTRRFTFTEEFGDFSGEYDGVKVDMCAEGVREWFDVPRGHKQLDLVLSNEPLRNGYRLTFLSEAEQTGGLHDMEPQRCVTPNGSYPAPCLATHLDRILFTFAQEFGACHVAVEC